MNTTTRPNQFTQPVYHYTTRDRLESILEEGAIRVATAGVFNPEEIPAVWLSTATAWERTANKAKIVDGMFFKVSLTEMVKDCGLVLMRIRIDPAKVSLIYPAQLCRALKFDKKEYESMVRCSKKDGASPMQWRAVAGPVPVSAFLGIEVSHECAPIQWVSLDYHKTAQPAG